MPLSSLLLSQLANPSSVTASTPKALQTVLRAIREHMGMDVAFLAEIDASKRLFRMVDAAGSASPIQVCDSNPIEETYCRRIVDGRLPQILPDALSNPISAALPITNELNIRAYVGVPVMLSDGQVYGTLCCYSSTPNETLNERDLGLLRAFAELAAAQVERDVLTQREHREISERIKSVLDGNALSIVYQPIYHVGLRQIVGVESLSRFVTTPRRTPDVWFAEAAKAGLTIELETAALRAALQGLPSLPDDLYVSINASPEMVLSGVIIREVAELPAYRIVLEITEHALIEQYDELIDALRPLRERGIRIAVDDAGSGYSSFRHILNLAPDIIKLDISLIRDIDSDPSRRALAAAIVGFAGEMGMTLIAEGIETAAELQTIQHLGIRHAQGYLLGKPMPIQELLQAQGDPL
jgi:EAL domain-containing protein (putative c-di-GMP-specific phosphodiesterase class I)